jgi:hypothetical protein
MGSQDSAQMRLAQDDEVADALAPHQEGSAKAASSI